MHVGFVYHPLNPTVVLYAFTADSEPEIQLTVIKLTLVWATSLIVLSECVEQLYTLHAFVVDVEFVFVHFDVKHVAQLVQ